jgi:hypothetical protein
MKVTLTKSEVVSRVQELEIEVKLFNKGVETKVTAPMTLFRVSRDGTIRIDDLKEGQTLSLNGIVVVDGQDICEVIDNQQYKTVGEVIPTEDDVYKIKSY